MRRPNVSASLRVRPPPPPLLLPLPYRSALAFLPAKRWFFYPIFFSYPMLGLVLHGLYWCGQSVSQSLFVRALPRVLAPNLSLRYSLKPCSSMQISHSPWWA
jgi:hypothetical protein